MHLKKLQFLLLACCLTAMLAPPEVHAWGAAHAGYTSYGAGGVSHYGATAASGPYGSRTGKAGFSSSGGTTSYHASGTVNSGLYAGQGYHYSGTTTSSYSGGGFRAGSVSGGSASAGVYRRW